MRKIYLLFALVLLFPFVSADWTSNLNNGLVKYYAMNETAGNVTELVRGNPNMTIIGTPIRNASGIIGGGNAFNAGAADKALNVSNWTNPSNLPIGESWTLSFWVYLNGSVAGQTFIGNNQVLLKQNGGGYFNMEGNSFLSGSIIAQQASNKTWYNVIMRMDNSDNTFKLYINNNLSGSATPSATPNFSSQNFYFGAAGVALVDECNCTIDEVGIWNRSLTTQEISALYNNGLGISYLPSAPNLPFNYTYSVTANTSSYETARETFLLNVSFNTSVYTSASATLNFRGTSYTSSSTGSGGDLVFNRSVDVPNGVSSTTFNWTISLTNATQTYSSLTDSTTLTIFPTIFNLCNSSQNVKYLNFTFRNETSNQEQVTATVPSASFVYWLGSGEVNKTLSYSSSILNSSYQFCLTPQNRTLYTAPSFAYENPVSPQRLFNPSQLTLTNISTNYTLFLLPTQLGQYVTFQVLNPARAPISGALVNVSRSGFGDVESKLTDASGGATFFMNPNFAYTIIVNKSGYSNFVTSITPTQTSYTIVMGSDQIFSSTTIDTTQGIDFSIQPTASYLTNRTNYNFNFTLSSDFWTVSEYGFELRNGSGYFIGKVSSTSNGGTVNILNNTANHTTIVMNAYWIVTGNYTNVTRVWTVYDGTGSEHSISSLLDRIRTYMASGGIFGLKPGFNMNLAIFIAIFVTVGVLGYSFGLYAMPYGSTILVGIMIMLVWVLSNADLIVYPSDTVEGLVKTILFIVVVAMATKEVTQG